MDLPEELDTLLVSARERHHARITALDALAREHSALGEALNEGLTQRSTVWERVAEAFGPSELAPHLRKLLGQIPIFGEPTPEPVRASMLERKLERVQRELIRLDVHLERVAADRDALEGEMEQLTARMAGADSKLAQVRLRSVLGLHHEFLRLTCSVEAHLVELRGAAQETLDALDRQLARLAAEAQVRDLEQVVSGDLDDVRAAVARVNRCASAGAVLLTENLDRLADEVDLLAPATPAMLAAEQEVGGSLHQDDLDELLRYTREQAQRNRDLRRQLERERD